MRVLDIPPPISCRHKTMVSIDFVDARDIQNLGVMPGSPLRCDSRFKLCLDGFAYLHNPRREKEKYADSWFRRCASAITDNLPFTKYHRIPNCHRDAGNSGLVFCFGKKKKKRTKGKTNNYPAHPSARHNGTHNLQYSTLRRKLSAWTRAHVCSKPF